MAKINETPTSFRTFTEQASAPATPGAATARLYIGDEGILRWVDSVGTVHASNSLEPVDYGATSRTLDAGDFFRLVRFTNSGAVTVTIPTEAGAGGSVGTTVWIHAAGAGGVTVVGDTGVTIVGTTELAEGETLQFVEVATDTWLAVEPPAAAGGGGGTTPEGFRAYRSTNQSLSAATFTKIVCDTEVIDQGTDYDPSTGEWTVPATGWYDVGGAVFFQSLASGNQASVSIYVNGSANTQIASLLAGAAGNAQFGGSLPLYLTAGDVVTLYAYRQGAGNVFSGAAATYFTAKSA